MEPRAKVKSAEWILQNLRDKLSESPEELHRHIRESLEDLVQPNSRMNVLHILAESKQTKEDVALLLRFVIRQLPTLLSNHRDPDGRTPLHIAIASRNETFVEAVLDCVRDGLEGILATQDFSGASCLHVAVRNSKDAVGRRLLETLIDRVPPDAWMCQDKQGLTPLHRVTHFHLYMDAQEEVVSRLATRCGDALLLQHPMSVYLYHLGSRREGNSGDFWGCPESTRDNENSLDSNSEHTLFCFIPQAPKDDSQALKAQDYVDTFGQNPAPRLALVLLPGDRLQIATPARRPLRLHQALRPHSEGRGRNDLAFIFGNLLSAGVQKIFHLVVSEKPNRPHTDHAIRNALLPFDIEILEWAKPDLCPDTIIHAAPNVRQLTLCWTGSNVALRAWSQPDALPQLRLLKRLTLKLVENPLEDHKDIQDNVLVFQRRLNLLRRGLEIHTVFPRQSERDDPELKWFAKMQIVSNIVTRLSMKLSVPVARIGLFGDHVDVLGNAILRTKIQLVDYNEPGSTWRGARTGHCTEVAEAIVQIAPFSRIYFYGVLGPADGGVQDPLRTNLRALTAEALENARQKVDILCIMSPLVGKFTTARHADDHDRRNYENALEMCRQQGLIVLQGGDEDLGLLGDDAIRISSVGEATVRTGWTNPIVSDFVFPGRITIVGEEEEEEAGNDALGGYRDWIACGLATGLVSLLLYAARMLAMEAGATGGAGAGGKFDDGNDINDGSEAEYVRASKELRYSLGMKKALRTIVEGGGNDRYSIFSVDKTFGRLMDLDEEVEQWEELRRLIMRLGGQD
ncbi:hypothetical protein B0T21DRAFT_410904 [Apiosordaria backusii]|uniref:Uncharacterized protein n=1 Tax=Apiosordaria backusii TaxID=314023 RepID=A0AA40BNP7_9PEZI|nr:hypothetical protein B0T21DRAFT_410904 [Apiosordaria backusii]